MVVKGIVALLICKIKVVAFLLSDVDYIFYLTMKLSLKIKHVK